MKNTLIRKILTLNSIILIILVSISCKSSKDKIEINIIGENTSTMQAMMTIESEYERENPLIDLKFNPNTFDDAFNKSNQDFANKTGLYDIVIQYNFSLSSFMENDFVYTIDEINGDIKKEELHFEKDIYPNYWKELGYYFNTDDQSNTSLVQVGYPSASLTMLLMYNKSMFEDSKNRERFFAKYKKQLEVPKNWDDYVIIADFFTDSSKGEKGVCIEGGAGGFLYFELMNFLGGINNGKILNSERGWDSQENTEVIVNSQENLQALKLYKKMKKFNMGQYSNVEQFEQMRIMKEGKTAMAFVWSDMIYPSLYNEKIDSRFGFSEIPGKNSILGGGAYFINKQTKNKKEVAQFINYLMQESTQKKMALKGFCSPLKNTYSDSEVMKLPYSKALANSLERANIALVAGIDSNIINETITTYVQKYWNDEITAEKTLELIQGEIISKRGKMFKTKNFSN